MKHISSLLIASTLFTGAVYADGLGVSIGPLSLQLGTPNIPMIRLDPRDSDPICRAIGGQRLLEMIVQIREKINDKEFKVITKAIKIEPYLFGIDKRHQFLLKGKVVDERMIKEVSVKFGADADADEKGLSGTFQIEKQKGNVISLNVDRIQEIRLIDSSHFDIPKDYDPNSYSDIVNVICEVDTNN